ncbi:MAG TPA: MFS transporter [Ktedonobacteraceae bacterium]|nr:MFS transporter [Ktedonobacteraceae bacterium]
MSHTDRTEVSLSSTAQAPVSQDVSKAPVEEHDPYKALRHRDFRFFFLAVFLSAIGEQMLSVAIGWELYERTSSALALGFVGLAQVLPVILFSLPAGHIVDRANRKRVVVYARSILLFSTLSLALLSYTRGSLVLIYGCLLLIGVAEAFGSPASSAMLSQTVPGSAYESAATWESSSWQLASVMGPALGGLIIAFFRSAAPVYLINTLAIAVVILCILFIRGKQPDFQAAEKTTLHALMEGLTFLRKTQVILASITLDLFAVLLGGATALLPVYARDILHVGPTGLGWLQAAPAVGALLMTLCLAHLPPFKRAGRALLLAVAIFGLATCIFGLSQVFWLSLLMLAVLGAMDNISVVIRGTLLLTRTPEEMRGRVSSVNTLFISMSNQLGGFESGMAAQFFGPVGAVSAGGIGTILVVILVAILWPEMRKLGALSERTVM